MAWASSLATKLIHPPGKLVGVSPFRWTRTATRTVDDLPAMLRLLAQASIALQAGSEILYHVTP